MVWVTCKFERTSHSPVQIEEQNLFCVDINALASELFVSCELIEVERQEKYVDFNTNLPPESKLGQV